MVNELSIVFPQIRETPPLYYLKLMIFSKSSKTHCLLFNTSFQIDLLLVFLSKNFRNLFEKAIKHYNFNHFMVVIQYLHLTLSIFIFPVCISFSFSLTTCYVTYWVNSCLCESLLFIYFIIIDHCYFLWLVVYKYYHYLFLRYKYFFSNVYSSKQACIQVTYGWSVDVEISYFTAVVFFF